MRQIKQPVGQSSPVRPLFVRYIVPIIMAMFLAVTISSWSTFEKFSPYFVYSLFGTAWFLLIRYIFVSLHDLYHHVYMSRIDRWKGYEEAHQETLKSQRFDKENRSMSTMMAQGLDTSGLFLEKVGDIKIGKLPAASITSSAIEEKKAIRSSMPDMVSFENHVDFESVSLSKTFLGIDQNNEPVVADLTRFIHTLISGATSSGKSTFLNNLLTQILLSKENVDIDLIDLAGQTFTSFDLPYARDDEEAEGVIDKWNVEFRRRRKLFEQTRTPEGYGIKTLAQYNMVTGENLPHTFLIIEEGSELLKGSEFIEDSVRVLAAQARKYSLSIMLITQTAKASDINSNIRANFSTRFQFASLEKHLMRAIVPGLDPEDVAHMGRVCYFTGKEKIIMQAPLVSDASMKTSADRWGNRGDLIVPKRTVINGSAENITNVVDILEDHVKFNDDGMPIIDNTVGTGRKRLVRFLSLCKRRGIDYNDMVPARILSHVGLAQTGDNYRIFHQTKAKINGSQ